MNTKLLIGGIALALVAVSVDVQAYHVVSPPNHGYIQVEDLVILCETDGPGDPFNGGVLNAIGHPGLGGMCFMTGNPATGAVACAPGNPIPLPVCNVAAPALSGAMSQFVVSGTNTVTMDPTPSVPVGPAARNLPYSFSVGDQFGFADDRGACIDDDYAQINDGGHTAAFIPLLYVEINAGPTVGETIVTLPVLTTGDYTDNACTVAGLPADFIDVSVDAFGNPLGVAYAAGGAQDDLYVF